MRLILIFLLTTLVSYSQSRKIPVDTMVVTNHTGMINGQNLSYTATAGTQPVWDNRNLQGVRIADLIREQTAVRVQAGGKGEIVFRENFIAMTELKERVAPDVATGAIQTGHEHGRRTRHPLALDQTQHQGLLRRVPVPTDRRGIRLETQC